MEIEIISHSHFPAVDPARLGKLDTLVIYRVDNKRQDTIMLPGEIDDVKVIQAKIAEKAKSRGAVVGHKFTV